MAYTHCEPECQAKCKDISLTECNSAPFRDSRVCEAECIPMIDDLDLTNAVPAAKRDENSVPEMIPPPGFYPPFPNPILLDVCKGITKDGKSLCYDAHNCTDIPIDCLDGAAWFRDHGVMIPSSAAKRDEDAIGDDPLPVLPQVGLPGFGGLPYPAPRYHCDGMTADGKSLCYEAHNCTDVPIDCIYNDFIRPSQQHGSPVSQAAEVKRDENEALQLLPPNLLLPSPLPSPDVKCGEIVIDGKMCYDARTCVDIPEECKYLLAPVELHSVYPVITHTDAKRQTTGGKARRGLGEAIFNSWFGEMWKHVHIFGPPGQ